MVVCVGADEMAHDDLHRKDNQPMRGPSLKRLDQWQFRFNRNPSVEDLDQWNSLNKEMGEGFYRRDQKAEQKSEPRWVNQNAGKPYLSRQKPTKREAATYESIDVNRQAMLYHIMKEIKGWLKKEHKSKFTSGNLQASKDWLVIKPPRVG